MRYGDSLPAASRDLFFPIDETAMTRPSPAAPQAIHTAVIDAGSSGTRLFLYRVEPGPFAHAEKLLEKEFSTMASGAREDGINNFVRPDDPAAEVSVVPEVIDPLLEHARAFLTSHGVEPGAVEVNLLSTAGMRYAEALHGREAVDRLYGTIRHGIAARGFAIGEIRTTCGNEEEGIWTWVNLNDVVRQAFETANEPLGIIEIGGSSMQISFPTDEPPDTARHIHPVTLNGRTFAVYCRSFLGLGQDDARKEMRRRLGPQGSAVCFPTGFRAAHDHGDVIDGVGEYRLAADGAYDFDACSSTYEAIVRDRLEAAGSPDLSHSLGDFVGIDAVYHATRHWGIEENPETLRSAIESHCHDVDTFPGIETGEYIQPQAANATYVQTLLFGRDGLFRRTDHHLLRALPSRDGEGTLLNWTRGYLICRYSR
jgi:hypothetical protein